MVCSAWTANAKVGPTIGVHRLTVLGSGGRKIQPCLLQRRQDMPKGSYCAPSCAKHAVCVSRMHRSHCPTQTLVASTLPCPPASALVLHKTVCRFVSGGRCAGLAHYMWTSRERAVPCSPQFVDKVGAPARPTTCGPCASSPSFAASLGACPLAPRVSRASITAADLLPVLLVASCLEGARVTALCWAS